jgi:hypothetical protein
MPRYSPQYLAQLLTQRDYGALVDLQGVATGWDGFDASVPSFGLPGPIFVVFEMLVWLATADRSGVWTYYETTPDARSECAKSTLAILKAVELQEKYAYGKAHWRDADASGQLDRWILENEQMIIDWAFAVLAAHPDELALVSS